MVISVFDKTKAVERLTAEHKTAVGKKVEQEKLDKIQSKLDSAQEELRAATEALEKMDVHTIHRENKFFELQILEHPTSTQVK